MDWRQCQVWSHSGDVSFVTLLPVTSHWKTPSLLLLGVTKNKCHISDRRASSQMTQSSQISVFITFKPYLHLNLHWLQHLPLQMLCWCAGDCWPCTSIMWMYIYFFKNRVHVFNHSPTNCWHWQTLWQCGPVWVLCGSKYSLFLVVLG